MYYHTTVIIYRLISCTVLVPKSGATNELVIREQLSSDGGAAVVSSCTWPWFVVVPGGGGLMVSVVFYTWNALDPKFLPTLGTHLWQLEREFEFHA